MTTGTTLTIFASVFFLLGIAAALLVVWARRDGDNKADDQEPNPSASSLPSRDRPSWESGAPSASQPPARQQEIARLWRDRETGELSIELDGRVYNSTHQLSISQREQLNQTAQALLDWMGPTLTTPTVSASRPPAPPTPISVPPITSESISIPSSTAPATPIKQDRDLVSLFVRSIEANAPKLPTHTKTIAAQIDDIVQERLVDSPLAGHRIRLVDTPDHGMAVEIGDRQYDSISAVPENEIRLFLQEAVQIWQRRSTSTG